MFKQIIDKYSKGQWAGFFYATCFMWICTAVALGSIIHYKEKDIKAQKELMAGETKQVLDIGDRLTQCRNELQEAQANIDQLKAIEFNTLVEPAIIKGIIQIESAGNAKAINKKEGAVGLMQLRPIVYDKICGMTKKEAFDPKKNVACGSLYFKSLLNKYGGNLEHALHYYNSGSPQDNGYADKVMNKICKDEKSCPTP